MSRSDGTFILVATYPDEQAAREDPVVQEFARMLHAEVGEVRALDPHDGDES